MSARLLILGGRGMLGVDLAGKGKERCDVTSLDLPEVDITQRDRLLDIVQKARPDFVVNCAAWTDVDGAESNAEAARAVNADGARNAAAAAKHAGARFIHISTDFVFDGKKSGAYTEDDPPNPLSVYGRTKLEGERAVLEENPDALVVRTAWLYGLHGKNFVAAIFKRAAAGGPLRVVTDQVGSPTWTGDLAGAILALVEKKVSGLVHFANAGRTSRFDQAREILRAAHLSTEIVPIRAAELASPAERPSRSELSCAKYARLTGLVPRGWEEAQAEFVTILLAESA